MIRVALAGNPNSGKTTLFNNLTGSTAHVGNWPGVTVDKREGTYKKKGLEISVVDLPGIYSLSPYTPEEVIARNYILNDKPDCVINVVDSTNLERNLYLTTQLLEIDVPLVVALNMTDELTRRGESVDVKKLSEKMGVTVVAISALQNKGIHELMEAVSKACTAKREGTTVLDNKQLLHLITDVKIALQSQNVENALFHAIKLAEMDEMESTQHPQLLKMVEGFKATFNDDTFGSDTEALIADARYKYISVHFSTLYNRSGNKAKLTRSDKIDRVLTNRWLGIPIFLAIMFVVFHFTFSENFLFLRRLIPEDWESLSGTAFQGVFGAGSINSPGVILQSLMGVFTDWLTGVVRGWLSGSSEWVSGLICDGVMAGVGSVLSFVPQVLLLFMFFSILEDSGYMARVAFILDRIFRRFGLSGRAFMPMIMGFGCSIPAMINTRTLADEKERIATIRVIPFFSCGAKLPILTAVAGAIVSSFGVSNADVITYLMYVAGIVTAIVTVLLMRNTSMRGHTPPFIMELPQYHLPQFKSLVIHLWDKLKHFVKKAFTIILASTIVVWVTMHFSFDWKYLSDEQIGQSILAGLGKLVQPLFTPVGFGSQLGEYGWVFAVAAVSGLIAKENVISTFATLAAGLGAVIAEDPTGIAYVEQMIAFTGATVAGLIAFIIFNMTTIPCFAAVASAKAELRKGTLGRTLLFWIVTSYIASAVVYVVLSWWWTVFIVLAVAALAVAGVVIYNKKHPVRR
ncbi:MAG TPA: ferrous iron transport protein B [Candidatus Limihabitans stercoravium]|nr:ferrous iron transport protein B [Candidatus Limihabitans stercoravium]